MRWPQVLAAFACLFVAGILDNARGPLYPAVLDSLRLKEAEGAWFFAAASATGALGSLGGQAVIARLGIVAALRAGLVLVALGVLAIGRATALPSLVAGAGVLGLGLGALALVHGALLERSVPEARRRGMFSALHSMYGASSFLAPPLIAALRRWELGWQASFQALVAIPLALLVLTARLGEPPGRDVEAPALPPGEPPPPVHPAAPAPSARRPLAGDARRRALVVSLIAALYVGAELALTSRLVRHLLQDHGASADAAGQHLSVLFGLLAAGRALGAFVRVPLENRPLLVATYLASAAFAALGLLVHPALLCLTGLSFALAFPTLMDLVAREFPAEFSRVTSLLLFVVSATVMLTHALVGLVADASSLRVALGVAPVYLLLGAALVPFTAPRRAG